MPNKPITSPKNIYSNYRKPPLPSSKIQMQLQNENTVVHVFLKYAPFIVIPTPAIKTQGHYPPSHT